MLRLERGLYEVLITEALDSQLLRLGDDLESVRGRLKSAEAADRIELHLARVLGQAIASFDERTRTQLGIELARRLIDMIREMPCAGELAAERPVAAGELLQSVSSRLPDGRSRGVYSTRSPVTSSLTSRQPWPKCNEWSAH